MNLESRVRNSKDYLMLFTNILDSLIREDLICLGIDCFRHLLLSLKLRTIKFCIKKFLRGILREASCLLFVLSAKKKHTAHSNSMFLQIFFNYLSTYSTSPMATIGSVFGVPAGCTW